MKTQQELTRLRKRAAALRREGKSRREIQAMLGPMGNSTLNDILKGAPPARVRTPRQRGVPQD